MIDVRAPTRASASARRPLLGLGKDAVTRLRNLLYAGLLALALMVFAFLHPLDQLIWTVQSRLVDRAPSGDIVFVGADRDMADPRLPVRRTELATALVKLNELGVGRVYVDIAFSEPSTSEADKELADALALLGPRAVLVDRIDRRLSGQGSEISSTVPAVGGDTRRVVSNRKSNWMGLIWTLDYTHTVQQKRVPSFAASLAGIEDLRAGEFQLDYTIRSEDLPTIELSELIASSNVRGLAGRTIVIGQDAGQSEIQQRVPGNSYAPDSFVAIYGAESLKAGRIQHISALPALVIFLSLFVTLLLLAYNRHRRYLAYGVIAGFFPVSLYLGSLLGVRLELSYCATTVLAYAIIRSRSRWKNRIALVDTETNLPKLKALEENISSDLHLRGHLVVARIHGYEHVLKTLPRNERAQYILKLVERLRAVDSRLEIYSEGHHLAWHSKQEDSAVLAEHLEGTRAMFAAPIDVAGSSVDVGISFGVAKLDGDPAVRLAAAVAAAEESSEALQPIKIAESNSRFDELWDISLRARIDEAMSAGEIFCVYQPKIDTRNGKMTGVEALVRWEDPARGFIPPMHFIAQCEKAGRMEALTQYVLEHACSAARLMHFRGRSITMSVNISATLLSDMRIVGMVRNVLQATGFDARFLVLEVTETSRIGNLETAEMVLNELKVLGARISMDDFGVGETNFETFFELPFDELKIDRLFVANMAKSVKAKSIVASIVGMGRDARIGVVAEGAEDTETLKMLTEIGCTHVQGYILARPMSLDNLMEFNGLEGNGALEA